MTSIKTRFTSIVANADNEYILANSWAGRRYLDRAYNRGVNSVDEAWQYAARMVARDITTRLEAAPCLCPSTEAMERAINEACTELNVPMLVLNSTLDGEAPREGYAIASWHYTPELRVWCSSTF